jgi:DNA polymerase
MAKSFLFFDYEARSLHDLTKIGGDKWSQSCRPTLCGWVIDDGKAEVWDARSPIPKELDEALSDNTDVIKVAHNARFEWLLTNNAMGYASDWAVYRCTRLVALSLSLPGNLDALCQALGLPKEKSKIKDGKSLVKLFCTPKSDRDQKQSKSGTPFWEPWEKPDDWERFIEYCRMDVVSMKLAFNLMPAWNYPKVSDVSRCSPHVQHSFELSQIDNEINTRGLPVDVELAHGVMRSALRFKQGAQTRLERITNGEITSGGQTERMLKFVNDRLPEGARPLTDCTAGTVAQALAREDIPATCKQVLEIRRDLSKTSTTKFKTVICAAGDDSRIRGCYQLWGAARTGRFAGYLLQPHNMPRGDYEAKDDDGIDAEIKHSIDAFKSDIADFALFDLNKAASNLVRPCIAAPPGKTFAVQDYSNIESRVLAWIAGEQWKLDAFFAADAGTGPDVYKLVYARSFDLDVDRIDKAGRTMGKVQDLACGYMGGIAAMETWCGIYGLPLTRKEMGQGKAAWRKAHPATVRLWSEIDAAAKGAIKNPGQAFKAGYKGLLTFQVVPHAGKSNFASITGIEPLSSLVMRLPSGRVLCYHNPGIKKKKIKFIDPQTLKTKVSETEAITFYGEKRADGTGPYRPWTELDTYAGKLTENATQAISYDFFTANWPELKKSWIDITGHTHDEIFAEIDESDTRSSQIIARILTTVPGWADNRIPLNTEGFETPRYKKG